MYFEASVFNFLFYGTRWRDPNLSSIGVEMPALLEREGCIWEYLESLNSLKKTDAALKRLFGADGKTMLGTVLGPDAEEFWENYLNCRRWRNQISHRGHRIYFETVPQHQQADAGIVRDRTLRASLCFVPTCWVVFSKLWNEYLHKPTLATGC